MTKANDPNVTWADAPAEHDYPAAATYLGLILDPETVDRVVEALRHATCTHHRANDLLRASGLPLLPEDSPRVAHDLQKARRGDALSPVLLVRGDLVTGRPLCIADGYHRVCASHHIAEGQDIPGCIVDIPTG